MSEVNRRTFINATAGSVAAASLAARASAEGPNETIRAGDILWIVGEPGSLQQLSERFAR